MVQADRPEPESPARRTVSTLGVLSALGVAALALAVLANLTTVPEPDEPTVTTLPLREPTTTSAFRSQGEPLDFQMVLAREGSWPLGLVEDDGVYHLFLSVERDRDGWSRGIETLISADGTSWESLGIGLEPPSLVRGVVGNGTGFLAYGGSPYEESALVWTSDDGVRWEEVPIDLDIDGDAAPFLLGAYATDAKLLLYGSIDQYSDGVWESISAALSERYGELGGYFDYHPTGAGSYVVSVRGPLGILLVGTTTDELGLEPEDLTSVPYQPGASIVWLSSDGVEWERTAIPDMVHPQSMATGPNQEIQILGFPQDGPLSLWASKDGVTWEQRQRLNSNIGQIVGAGSRWIATSIWGPDLLISADLEEWVSTDVDDLFADSRPWHASGLTADDQRIAAVIRSVPDRPYVAPDPIEVERSGYLMTVTEPYITIVEPSTGNVALQVSRWSTSESRGVSFDPETGTVSFVDPGSGATLMAFGLEELTEIEREFYDPLSGWPTGDLSVLVFSEDDVNWVSQELRFAGQGHFYPIRLDFLDDRLLLMVSWYEPNRGGIEGFELWAATVPQR